MHPPYPRAEMKRQIVDGLERGWGTLTKLTGRSGWPHRQTVYRWTLEDAVFARQLKLALDWRRQERRETCRAPSFNASVAEKILRGLAEGASLRAISQRPGVPHLVTLHAWLWTDADFARDVAMAREDGMIALADRACRVAASDGGPEARRAVGEIYKQMGRMRTREPSPEP